MGINRDRRHKHRATGGRRNIHQKKRKYELGRPMVHCHLGPKRVRVVRVRGGGLKYRALRLDSGNFAWGSENMSCKARIMDVIYNASSNELVRTKTLCKNAIIQVEAAPFKTKYLKKYGVDLGRKAKAPKGKDKKEEVEEKGKEEVKKSKHLLAKLAARAAKQKLDPHLEELFQAGRLMVCISSRPGQSGRVDGYVLEGEELTFYKRKLEKKKK